MKGKTTIQNYKQRKTSLNDDVKKRFVFFSEKKSEIKKKLWPTKASEL